jgi:sigma-B regulation protein RsbU (phosphoserine phosphatase)
LGTKLFAVIALVVLATITVNAWQNSRFFYTQLILRMQEMTMAETRKGASSIETILDSWIGQIAVVTNGISGISKRRYMDFTRNFVGSNMEFVAFELAIQDDKGKLDSLGFLLTPNGEDPRFGAIVPKKAEKIIKRETSKAMNAAIAHAHRDHQVVVRNLGPESGLPLVMVAMPFYVNGSKSLLWAILTVWQTRLAAAFPQGGRTLAYLLDSSGRLVSASDPKMLVSKKVALPPYVAQAMKAKNAYGLNRWMVDGHHMLGAFTEVRNYRLKLVSISDGSAAVAAIQAIIKRTVLWAVLLILGVMVISVLTVSGITRNLRALTQTALQIAAGNFQSAVVVRSRDEAGLLGHAVNHMARRIVEHLHEKVAMARIEQELQTAQMVQDCFFPRNEQLNDGKIRIAPFFSPASECGGDWWGVYELSERYRLVCIADATGHGLPAALITAMSYAGTAFMARILEKKKELRAEDLEQMLQDFNRVLFEGGKNKFTMTYFALVIDLKQELALYINAGHNFPFLIPENADDARLKSQRSQRVKSLSNTGLPLGMRPHCDLQVKETKIVPGDRIFLFTDGLFECTNSNGEQWGKRRFQSALVGMAESSTETIRDEIVKNAYDFFNGFPPGDDVTVVVVQIGPHKTDEKAVFLESA